MTHSIMIGFWRRLSPATITKDSLAGARLFLLWCAWAEMWHFLISFSHQTIFRQKVKVRYLVSQSWANFVFWLWQEPMKRWSWYLFKSCQEKVLKRYPKGEPKWELKREKKSTRESTKECERECKCARERSRELLRRHQEIGCKSKSHVL